MAIYLFAAKALPPTVLYRSYAPEHIKIRRQRGQTHLFQGIL